METFGLAVPQEVFVRRRCGLSTPYYVTEEVLDQLKEFLLYPDDLWVVTFPKSGTTWTQQIVKLIKNNGVEDGVKVTHSVPWLEGILRHPEVNIDALARPRAFKSHFPYDLLPCGPPHTTPCKYIYIARNPKDVAVSMYFHYKELYIPGIDWDSYWEKFISWDLPYGNYFDHVLSWWSHRSDENVLFLKFEDMKKNLPCSVSRIASFMGIDMSDDIIAKIADMTTFEKMKKNPFANRAWVPVDKNFMRKGVVGDWRNFLTAEQSAQIDVLCADRLKDTGLEFEFV